MQLDGAFEYLSGVGAEPVQAAAFETAAGVGVSVTPEDVAAGVAAAIEAAREQLLLERCAGACGRAGVRCQAQARGCWAP